MDRILKRLRTSWPLKLLVYFGVWTVPGLISGTQLMLSYSMQGEDPPWSLLLQITLPSWYAWALLAPVVYIAARRHPLGRGRNWRALGVHLALNVAALLVSAVLVIGLRRLIGGPSMGSIGLQLAGSLNTSLITYWTIVLIAHAVQYYEDAQKKALRSAELATQLSDARLNVLKAQLHPHFLFNTMHAISAFLHEEPEKAETMLAELAELLRLALESTTEQIVPLSKELDFVDRYLSIQKTRLGDRLTVEVDVAPELATAGVPSMLLQPLVENAVEHGIAKRIGPGHLRLRIHRRSQNLWMEVGDDGPGLPEKNLQPSEWRVGLRNTSERLVQLYGDDHSFELSNPPEGGLLARVVIPYTDAAGTGP